MLRTLLYAFLIFVLWALFGRWYYTCRIKGCDCCETLKTEARTSNLRLTKEGSPDILKGFEQFFFAENSATPDLNADNQKFLAEASAYLKANPGETLLITACSRATENSNLGEGRASNLKNALVQLGVNANQITTAACTTDKMLSTAASFSLRSDVSQNINVAGNSKENDYLNISISDENFAFNSAIFQPKEDFINKANQLKNYSSTRPNISLEIVGHTDNIGNDTYNIQLGKKRADAVGSYFKKNGLKIKITTASKGESEPISTNDTEEGRAANRRINCKVIQ